MSAHRQAGARGAVHRALAPAKVNLGLFVGPARASDRRHELVTVMQSISLADELTLEQAPAGAERDEILCPGVPGPAEQNLAAAALRAFRASTGWDAPPQRLSIVKRIPLAAGLAGGSADAAATLRLASHASGLGDRRLLRELGAQLGADVPAQIAPGRWLATGAGEQLSELPTPPPSLGLLVLPAAVGLSTAAVYNETDRLGTTRGVQQLPQLRAQLLAALADGSPLPAVAELLHNDLQHAAISLCPEIARRLELALKMGADLALVSGSGPTVIGLFAPSAARAADGIERSELAAARMHGHTPAPICAAPVDATFGLCVTIPDRQPDE
jgi:4-diphosphocytidyl-2-C-methyl-D-erythritol kinase